MMMDKADLKYKTLPINSAALVEKVEDAITKGRSVTFSGEEREALLERLILFLPDWG